MTISEFLNFVEGYLSNREDKVMFAFLLENLTEVEDILSGKINEIEEFFSFVKRRKETKTLSSDKNPNIIFYIQKRKYSDTTNELTVTGWDVTNSLFTGFDGHKRNLDYFIKNNNIKQVILFENDIINDGYQECDVPTDEELLKFIE